MMIYFLVYIWYVHKTPNIAIILQIKVKRETKENRKQNLNICILSEIALDII